MGVHRACGEPDEIKKNTHPKYFTALFREQATVAKGVDDLAYELTPIGKKCVANVYM